MPYQDPTPRSTTSRRFNWIAIYSGPRAVTTSDFGGVVKARRVVSQAVVEGRWISLLNFLEKYRWDTVQGIIKTLHSDGSIQGPVQLEVPYGATARFPIQRLTAEKLLMQAMRSPCKVEDQGVWFCKLSTVCRE
jgi:hypothetical protein